MNAINALSRKKHGFTLVEVIVVLVILAILAAILVPSMIGWIKKAEDKEVYTELNIVAKAAKTAYVETFAIYSEESDFQQLIYSPKMPSSQPWDKMFSSELEDYIASDVTLSRVQSVFISGPDYHIVIRYQGENGKIYQYTEENNQVNIEMVA